MAGGGCVSPSTPVSSGELFSPSSLSSFEGFEASGVSRTEDVAAMLMQPPPPPPTQPAPSVPVADIPLPSQSLRHFEPQFPNAPEPESAAILNVNNFVSNVLTAQGQSVLDNITELPQAFLDSICAPPQCYSIS